MSKTKTKTPKNTKNNQINNKSHKRVKNQFTTFKPFNL